MRLGLAILFFLLLAGMAQAQAQESEGGEDAPAAPALSAAANGPVMADHAITGDEIALADGRVLRLTGIKAFDASRDQLQQQIKDRQLNLSDATTDRYGRVAAVARVAGEKQSLQDMLLSGGYAYVYPATLDSAGGDAQLLAGWLDEEKAARRDNRGRWRVHPDWSPGAATQSVGKYAFVSGIVASADKQKGKLYLNFGLGAHDFAVLIISHDLKAFKQAGLDPFDWQGRKLRVRGWIRRDEGPVMQITDPGQIEFN